MRLFVITSIDDKTGRTSEGAPFFAESAEAARAEWNRLYCHGRIVGIREASPLERAACFIQEQNSRRVSMAYGAGALREVQGAFGNDSLEAKAYAEYLGELNLVASKS